MQHRNQAAILFCCAVALCSHAHAQQPSADLTTLLTRLGEQATALERKLPSFSCSESIVSQVRFHGLLERNVKLSGTLRMVRDASGNLNETFTRTSHHFFPGSADPPFNVQGGFDKPLSYFLPSLQTCYTYSLTPGRIDFVGRTDDARPPFCVQTGVKGFALLDAVGNVTHIERQLPLAVSIATHIVYYAAVDLVPTELNGQTYQLSHHMVAERPVGDAIYHFESTYSNYRLFTATVTIGPATAIPPDDKPAPQK